MGRDRKSEQTPRGKYCSLFLTTVQTPAWVALSCYAKALYPLLLLEWKGPKANNNGSIQLSVRQAAEGLNIAVNTAAKAFHELQAKGFIVVKHHARLGVKGHATSPEYEITELAMPGQVTGRKLFSDWQDGADYPVLKATVHNPNGTRKRGNNIVRLVQND